MSDKEIIDKLIDLTEGTIDHFDREDAMDMLYEVKRLLGKRAESEQEPKTGHWMYICNRLVSGLKVVECSECGKRTYGSGKYCPNCGAQMFEPQESEDRNETDN